MRTTKTGETL